MDAKTLEALRGSIAKWEAIVDGAGIEDGPWNCPLCRLFLLKPDAERTKKEEGWRLPDDQQCIGCPVHEETGKKGCMSTPYIDYENAEYEDDVDALTTAALDELAFLKSLLPKDA